MRVQTALGAAGAAFFSVIVVAGCPANDLPPSTLFAETSTPDSSSNPDGSVVNESGVNDSGKLPDGAVPDSAACTLAAPPSDKTCAACLQTNCCGPANECLPSPDCVALEACITACTPDASINDGGVDPKPCQIQCSKAHLSSVSAAAHYDSCRTQFCAQQCP